MLGEVARVSFTTLAAVLLEIGAVLYGSGYVLLVFLRGELVEGLGWLTDRPLLDAIAIGQVTRSSSCASGSNSTSLVTHSCP